MTELIFERAEMWINPSGNWLALKVDKNHLSSLRRFVEEMTEGKQYRADLKEHKPRRSLDANSYFHVLVNEIARMVHTSDLEVKREMVFRYGTIARDDNGSIVGAMLPEGQNITAFYPYARCYKTDRLNGKNVNCYLFYKRTRDMTTAEFARLVEGTISEAKNLGIETMTPEELERIKENQYAKS